MCSSCFYAPKQQPLGVGARPVHPILKLAEATSNPKTDASLLSLADYWAKRADECAARALSISDSERRADMLRFAGLWLSLTEPAKDELRGAYEWPRQRAA